jgi:CO/xanthine dehydrogenase Mo-binding subunit
LKKYSVVGKSLPRVDAEVKVTGDAIFTYDIAVPRMLYGAILRSPHSHARIISVNTSEAEKLPGIKAVITGEEVKEKGDIQPGLEPVLAFDYVRFIGQGVAAVAAVDPCTALEALKLIEVEYEILPAVVDLREAMREGSALANASAASNVSETQIYEWGEIEKGFEEADYIREDAIELQNVHVCYMETTVAIADYEGNGKLTFWSSTQVPENIQNGLANILGLKAVDVRVIVPYVGGAHSNKINVYSFMVITSLLSRKSGRPVKLGLSREELLTEGRGTTPFIIKMKTGIKKNGTLAAMHCRLIAAGGPFLSPGVEGKRQSGGGWMSATYLPFPYRLPNIKFEGQTVMTNHVYGGQRGTGRTPIRIAYECHMNNIAASLNIDPLELRLRNALRTGDVAANGGKMHSCGLTGCLKTIARKTRWKERRGKLGSGRGLGLACYNYHTGSSFNRISSAAFVQVHDDGTANLIIGQPELGNGAHTVFSQIVAEELGLRLEDVRVSAQIDTDISPHDIGPTGSMGTHTTGNAVKAAADDARRQILRFAASRLVVKAKDLELKRGVIYLKSRPQKKISLPDLVRDLSRQDGQLILGKGTHTPKWEAISRQTGNMKDVPPNACGAIVVEIEVDKGTGHVELLKATVVHDIGFALNPALVEGQIEGQIHHGIGQALYEDHRTEAGRVLTSTFTDYRMPRSTDMPQVEITLLEIPDPRGPFGGKECAEGPQGGVAPAIIDAIYDAIGVRINSLPVTPEKIIKALKEKEAV